MKLVEAINTNDTSAVSAPSARPPSSIAMAIAIETNAKRPQDTFFKYYGYAVAEAICLGFHFVFPISRKKFSLKLKDVIMMEVNYALTGLQLSSVTIRSARLRIFKENPKYAWPDIAAEEISKD